MKIQKYVLITLIILYSISGFSQSKNNSGYSIGLKLLSVEELPKFFNEVRTGSKYEVIPYFGAMLKYTDNQISYRLVVSNSSIKDYSIKNECETCEVMMGKYKSTTVKIGFEKSSTYTRLQPFFGTDIGFKLASFNGDASDSNSSTFLYKAYSEKTGAIFYPFVGLKYTFTKFLTLSAETGIDFLYSYDKEVKSFPGTASPYSNRVFRWNYNFKPLGLLSLQFNFGER
ncbi:MAG: hypothetical protein ABIP95_11925 [Pelobium sp.]